MFAYERALFIFKAIEHLPVFIYTFERTIKIFRTRTHDTPERFLKVLDIANTPRKFVKDFARCNRPYQSIFYGSENRRTSFMELIEYWIETKNLGEQLFITMGLWENTIPINFIILTTPDKNKRVSQFDKDYGLAYDNLIKNKSKEEQEYYGFFFKYMFEKFRKPAKNDPRTYIITAAYFNLAIIEAQGKADGILYPSVPFEGNGVNLALKDTFAINNLKLTDAIWTQFEVALNSINKKDFLESYSIQARSVDRVAGTIEW